MHNQRFVAGVAPRAFADRHSFRDIRPMPAARDAQILIVDDSATIRVKLSSHFRERGWGSVLAASASEALVHLTHGAYHLIVSDVDMPQMDGMAFLRTVKANPRTAAIPFAFYSAVFETPGWGDLAYAAGAVRCLLKPMDPTTLLDEIQGVLEGTAPARATVVVAPPRADGTAAPAACAPPPVPMPAPEPAREPAAAAAVAAPAVAAPAPAAPTTEADLLERVTRTLEGAACLLDPEGVIEAVFGRFAEWFGGERAVLGRLFVDVVPLRSRADGGGPVAWLKPSPEESRAAAGVWTASGHWMELDVATWPMVPRPGAMPHTLVVLRDRSFERRLEEERRATATLVDALGAGVLTLDVTGRALRANPRFLAQLGYAETDLVGRSCRPLWGPAGSPQAYETIFRAALARGFEGEVEARRKDGTPLRVHLRAVAISGEQGVPVGTLWITRTVEPPCAAP